MEIMTISFAEALLKRLKGQNVEIYSGDVAITRQYSQDSIMMKDVLRGKLIDAEGELLILEYTDLITLNTTLVYINAWNVRAIVKPENALSMTDIFNSEHERVKK